MQVNINVILEDLKMVRIPVMVNTDSGFIVNT